MKTVPVLSVMLVCVGLWSAPTEGNVIGSCWSTWSRCSTWSKWFTGRAWLTCDGKCKQLGKRGGSCAISRSTCPFARLAYQCRCY